MARGVLSGMIWGSLASVVGLSVVSVAVDPPVRRSAQADATAEAPSGPVPVPQSQADPVPDPEIAREDPPGRGGAAAPLPGPVGDAPDQPRQPGVEDSGLTRAPVPSDNPDAPPMAAGPVGEDAPVIGEAGVAAPAPAPSVTAPSQPAGGDEVEIAGVATPGTESAPGGGASADRGATPEAEPGPEVATDPAAIPPAPEVTADNTATAPAAPGTGSAPATPGAATDDAPARGTPSPSAPPAPEDSGAPEVSSDPAEPVEAPAGDPAMDAGSDPEPAPEPTPDPQPGSATETPDPDTDAGPEATEGDRRIVLTETSGQGAAPRVGQGASDLTQLAPDVRTGRLPSLAGDRDEAETTEGAAGRRPVEQFAVPVEVPEDAPRLAIVLIDDGRGGFGSEALAAFPYPLTFAVNAAAPNAAERAADYRARGFEVLALGGLPEGAEPRDAEVALQAMLAAVPEAVGLMETPGAGLQGDRATATQVASVLAETGHGLVLFPKGLNTGAALAEREGVPVASVFRDLDGEGESPAQIRRQLDQAALRAGQDGAVLLAARLRPDTISALLLWGLQDRSGRLTLVPATGVLTGN